jgi:hypothetical protein
MPIPPPKATVRSVLLGALAGAIMFFLSFVGFLLFLAEVTSANN